MHCIAQGRSIIFMHKIATSPWSSRGTSHLIGSLVQSHLLPSKAVIRQARHFCRTIFCCTVCLGCVHGGLRAIVDVRTVSNCDWCLRSKKQFRASWYALCTNTLPDSQSIIIGCIAIKVAAVAILARSCMHIDLPIHILVSW